MLVEFSSNHIRNQSDFISPILKVVVKSAIDYSCNLNYRYAFVIIDSHGNRINVGLLER